jgi:phosphate transport system substrate-binding protein
VNQPVAEAAELLRAEKKLEIQVDTQGGSSGGISMLGEGLVQIGMSSKHISEDDKKKFPKCGYREIHIGEDAVALIVSKDVWDGGVKSFVDFMLSEPGQKLVKKHGYLMLSELKVPEGN